MCVSAPPRRSPAVNARLADQEVEDNGDLRVGRHETLGEAGDEVLVYMYSEERVTVSGGNSVTDMLHSQKATLRFRHGELVKPEAEEMPDDHSTSAPAGVLAGKAIKGDEEPPHA